MATGMATGSYPFPFGGGGTNGGTVAGTGAGDPPPYDGTGGAGVPALYSLALATPAAALAH